MSVFTTVSNWLLGQYNVRTTDLAANAGKAQHVRLDFGTGSAESQVSAGNPLPVTGSLTTTAGAIAGDGRKVVTTAGTRVALASSTVATRAILTAETSNTGLVVVGAVTVVAAVGTRRGVPLSPGATIEIGAGDLANIYIDSEQNGDGVTFLYEA